MAFSHPLIAPAIVNHSALPSASGRFATPRGELAVSWAYDSGRVALNVTLPPNVKATVMVPCTTSAVQEGGKPVWHGGKYQAGVEGVTGARLAPSRNGGGEMHVAVACDGAGEYSFSAQCAPSL